MDASANSVTIFRHPFAEGAQESRVLLLRAAAQYSGQSAAELGQVETGLHGKPFFPRQPQLHVSVTHSGDWWLCACSGQPVGLDLQIHRSHTDPAKLSRRFFHPAEEAWLAQRDHIPFYDVWCAKESWVKYTGTGFYQDPADFSVVDEQGSFPCMEHVQFRLLPTEPGYSLCLCAQTLGSVAFLDLSLI